ncbi:hypothetical protein RBU61_14275 [Tissierella sp. MB52-C2]|uniref:hypothetical protein n=1 Tax=Tissierella sp. MB52-C2 TaxID=3070999 RepID=UPI00280AE144|nr:hypothetical protein [Tissierella sp. MB52-C2]WMM24082.1 hypothetical protein RBU61_14275 [Tissierella sp. MB52-C2]
MFKNVASRICVEDCQEYYPLGICCIWSNGKDLTLIDKEKELSDGHLKSSTV